MTEPLVPTDTGPKPGERYTARLQAALVEFSGCIGNALDGICSFGLTMGENYVPFDLDEDEDCDEENGEMPDCSQAWVRVMSVTPTPGAPVSWDGKEVGVELMIDLEVGVIRCLDIPEDGEAPTTTEVLTQALQSVEDMNDMLCAAMSCDVWESISIGSWAPLGPLGGQHGGSWTFTVTV